MEGGEFRLPVRVYHEDVDTQGVVYYANYLRFMERARTEWLRSLGVEQDELVERGGVYFTVSRLTIDYKRPARFNDLLDVSVRMLRLGRASLALAQAIRLPRGELASEAQVQIVCVRVDDYRPTRIPAFLHLRR